MPRGNPPDMAFYDIADLRIGNRTELTAYCAPFSFPELTAPSKAI